MTSTSHASLTADQVAARLGVKLPTVYAYVSRGVLERTVAADGRTSLFDPAEVEVLARRGRPRAGTRVGAVDVSLATGITGILDNRLVYRGHDVAALAGAASFEQVAELLWTGELPPAVAWPDAGAVRSVVTGVGRQLPATSGVIERFAATTAAMAAHEPLRVDLRADAVLRHARRLIVALVESLPFAPAARAGTRRDGRSDRDATNRPRRRAVAHALWPRVSGLPATRARVATLDAVLVLLADHELATSTLAARVAASTRADPFAVVLAGLGAVSGPLHGKAALAAHQLLLDAQAAPAPAVAVARAVSTAGHLPGFGHPVYRGTDPRATVLLGRLPDLAARRQLEVVRAVADAARSGGGPDPNVDFALGAFAFVTGMPLGSTEAIFAIARTAGWIAHALEEYGEAPLRFRARAIYVGPRRP